MVHSILQVRANARSNAAQMIRTIRSSTFTDLNREQRTRMRTAFEAAYRHILKDVPPKPTKQNIYDEMIANQQFSKTSWVNQGDTEYCSACGIDDYHWEIRNEAKRHARELFRVWQSMPD